MPHPAFELTLQAGAVPLLPGCKAAGRPVPATLTWHDTADATLARTGLSLLESPQGWTLHRLQARTPGAPPATLDRADRREVLGTAVPAATAPAARWTGTRQRQQWPGACGTVEATVWRGTVDGAPLSRVSAAGTATDLLAFAAALAEADAAALPAGTFAAQALALARAEALAPPAPEPPQVHPGHDVGEAASLILGQLTGGMLHWAGAILATDDPEPVHQMRVATRRLRSMIALFGDALPALLPLEAPARDCAARLGAVRDWDAFLAGAGAAMTAAFPGDGRCLALVRAASRARTAAHAGLRGFLAGPAFRAVAVSLAVTAAVQPWRGTDAAGAPVEAFAAAALTRLQRKVRKAGRGIETLPTEALHGLRKRCKRLRYGVGFLSPLFPGRPTARLVRRLADLQEELGFLNDAATVPRLLTRLGRHERGYAAGLLVGMAEAQAAAARGRIEAAWSRFHAAEPSWHG